MNESNYHSEDGQQSRPPLIQYQGKYLDLCVG